MSKKPRAAATYRAARRNAMLRPQDGPPGVWQSTVTSKYRAVQPKGWDWRQGSRAEAAERLMGRRRRAA